MNLALAEGVENCVHCGSGHFAFLRGSVEAHFANKIAKAHGLKPKGLDVIVEIFDGLEIFVVG